MNETRKLNNPNARMVPGEFYGLVVSGHDADYYNQSEHDVLYNIELIKWDLPERMRYIEAVTEKTYKFADRNPGITNKMSEIRGRSVRFDRAIPTRETDGLYTSDPFADDEPAAIQKQLKKNTARRKKVEAKEEQEELNLG